MSTARTILLGQIFSTAGFSCWAIYDALMKMSGAELGISQMLLLVAGGTSIGTILLALGRGNWRIILPHHVPLQLLRAGLTVISWHMGVVAVLHLPLASFYLVVFLIPLLVGVLATLFLGEKFRWPALACSLVGFCGVALYLVPQLWPLPRLSLIGVGATGVLVLCGGVTYVLLRKLAVSGKEDPLSLVFMPATLTALVGLVGTLIDGWQPVPWSAAGMLALAVLANLVGWLLVVMAYAKAPAALVAPFHYVQLLWGVGFDLLLWQTHPSPLIIPAATLIIGAGLVLTRLREPVPSKGNTI